MTNGSEGWKMKATRRLLEAWEPVGILTAAFSSWNLNCPLSLEKNLADRDPEKSVIKPPLSCMSVINLHTCISYMETISNSRG